MCYGNISDDFKSGKATLTYFCGRQGVIHPFPAEGTLGISRYFSICKGVPDVTDYEIL
jgi:hypothetical protein